MEKSVIFDKIGYKFFFEKCTDFIEKGRCL